MKLMSKQTFIGFCIIVVIIAGGIGIWLGQKSLQNSMRPLKKVTVSTTFASLIGYPIYIALEKGYFKQEGLEVTLQNRPHGKANLNAVVEGKANLGLSSETPFMYAVLSGAKIVAFATMFTANKSLAIVARKDRGILTVRDLKGKTIGVTIGSNGIYFLETVLLLHDILREDVKTVHLKPNQMFDTLMKGEVDAIATWNPQMYRAQKALGDQGSTFYAEGLYAPLYVISARQDYVRTNPEIIERVVRSLIQATQFIHDYPKKSHKIAAQFIKIENSLLQELSGTYHFKIFLDQTFLINLENQTDWAMKNNLTDQTNVPNYLDFVYLDALKAVKPENMTIIQ